MAAVEQAMEDTSRAQTRESYAGLGRLSVAGLHHTPASSGRELTASLVQQNRTGIVQMRLIVLG